MRLAYRHSPLRIGTLFSFILLVNACSFVEHRNDVSFGETGQLVSEELLAQIVPGKTQKSWVLSYLGKPSSSAKIGKGEELLTYSYDTIKQKKLRVVLFYQTRSTQVESKKVFVSLKDGVVTRCWKDFSFAADAPEVMPEEDLR
jgi:outer membrane protein assembly factor BamE (lipoprotein component of BamABCDE complex)